MKTSLEMFMSSRRSRKLVDTSSTKVCGSTPLLAADCSTFYCIVGARVFVGMMGRMNPRVLENAKKSLVSREHDGCISSGRGNCGNVILW